MSVQIKLQRLVIALPRFQVSEFFSGSSIKLKLSWKLITDKKVESERDFK